MTIRPMTTLPTEVVFHPSWWHKNEGIIFDKDFFFDPRKRVEEERHMERALYERWGRYGLGSADGRLRPVVGPIHLAAGFIVSGMMGCRIEYQPDGSPLVVPGEADMDSFDEEAPFAADVFKEFTSLTEALKTRFGYLTGDVDWNGILNTALDVFGQSVFTEMADNPGRVKRLFEKIAVVEERFFRLVHSLTGSTSTAVNRTVAHFKDPVLLHSECSHTMIGEDFYRTFLLPFDSRWAALYPPYGIHFCGADLHRFASAYASIEGLSFLDVGWGSDIEKIKAALPGVFLNLRVSPVELVNSDPEKIKRVASELVRRAGNPRRAGLCCINIDDSAREEQVDALFEAAREIRAAHEKESA